MEPFETMQPRGEDSESDLRERRNRRSSPQGVEFRVDVTLIFASNRSFESGYL